jgi:predicted transcriptional regulator
MAIDTRNKGKRIYSVRTIMTNRKEFVNAATGMNSLDVYKKMGDEVQGIYRSRLITEILLALNEGNKKLLQLREIMGSTSQAIIPKIRKLEAEDLIEIRGREYCLTPIGKIVASEVASSFTTLGTINKFRHFWATHYLNGIPEPLIKEIGYLFNSTILRDRKTRILNVYNNQLKIFKEANCIHGVSSVVTEGYSSSVSERVKEGIPVELIVPPYIANKLKQPPYAERFEAVKDCENLKLKVTNEDIKIGLIVTDKNLSLNLYKKRGNEYDIATGLFSDDQKALEWGEKLFGYYNIRSVNCL